MSRSRSYTDERLVQAIKGCHSWRGVLRALGLSASSSAAIRSVRQQADALGCDYRHFRGQRSWSEDQLRSAVATASSWQDVADALGLIGGSAQPTIRGHAARLGIETGHLAPPSREPGGATDRYVPSSTHLARSGSLLAAAWFTLRGCEVSWPLEPSRYDLLVEHQGTITRVQVETATVGLGELDCMAIDDRQKSDALQCG